MTTDMISSGKSLSKSRTFIFFSLKILNSKEASESGIDLELRKFFCFPSIIDSIVTDLNEDTLKKR